MDETSPSRQTITIVEVVVVLLVLGFLIALLLPSIEHAGEAARRANCLNNLKQIGLGFQNMDSARRRFPSAIHVQKDANESVTALQGAAGLGWAWTVDILPYMELKPLWETIDLKNDWPLRAVTACTNALATPVKEYSCPSYSGDKFVDPTTEAEFITNYKALGATFVGCLARATPSQLPALETGYNPTSSPDGGCYPGSTFGTDGFSKDGTAHTALVVESTEPHFARWTVGVETCLVGLPSTTLTTPDGAQTFDSTSYPYTVPTGFDGGFWDKSNVTNNYTYLMWDYDDTAYIGPTDFVAGTPPAAGTMITYGPSSDHSGVINHMLADGSVQSISEDIDAAAYMFLITRAGGDPNAELQ